VPLQLPLHYFIINLKEVILPVYIFDLGSQALLRIRELLTKVFVLFSLLLRRPLNELVVLFDCGSQGLESVLEVYNLWIRCKEALYYPVRYLFWGARVAANAYIYKGPGEPIIGDITLEEGILYIESDCIIDIRTVEDSGKGIVSHDLVVYRIRYNT
jgi:hypothetical protein